MCLRVSDENSKLGRIPQINLAPVASCVKGIPCAKAGQCYAMKAWVQYPGVRAAWGGNLALATQDLDSFFYQLDQYLVAKRPRYFRFHSAGDCPSYAYFVRAIQTARAHPGTRFLMFTKRYQWADWYLSAGGTIPGNLALVLSHWPGLTLQNPHGLPVAYMQDGTAEDVPADAWTCPGSCATCKTCWHISNGRAVVFHKH